jgi:hypothetical protein
MGDGAETSHRVDASRPLRARLAVAALTVHAFALGAWLAVMPRGFPLSHPHFWLNQALPIIALLAIVIGGIGIARGKAEASRAALGALGGAWLGAAVTARLVFPVSAGWLAEACTVIALAGILLWRSGWTLVAAMMAALGGAMVPLCERGADPDTRPLNQAAPRGSQPGVEVQLACGRLSLRIDPMLRFLSTSPDRGWTILTPFAPRPEPRGTLTLERREGDTRLAAYTTLEAEVYSHLNTFTKIRVNGHSDLRVSFSAAPGFVMPVEPADYPIGRPSRFAYLGADDDLHVVQASSAEKGPFHELAHGALRNGILELTLFDGAEPQCHIALETWAAQAGRALSPTAGWGVPVNAIEMMRAGEEKSAPAVIFVSLAATSVGRGWDSVGHRAGTYVNRMTLHSEPADPKGEGAPQGQPGLVH